MITNIFVSALGRAIFESCGQALLIYVVLQIVAQLFPTISSKYKYDISYLGLTIICCWFLGNLVKIYLQNMTIAHYATLLYNSGMPTATYLHTQSLLQQVEGFVTQYAKYIAGLYMIGLILHAMKLFGGFVHIHHIRKQKNLQTDAEWTAKAIHLCMQLKIVKAVSLYFSEHVSIPLTIGYFKPIIIFPIALINNLDHDQVESILMHELAHIKRHDYLLNILQCIMETILCFNPFVWLISKSIREQREYCCDDMVVDADYNNFTYSKALLIIAQQNNTNYALAMASAGNKKYPLLNRIKRLHTMETKESLPKFNLLVIITIAAVGGLLAWGIPQYSTAKTTAKKEYKLKAYAMDKATAAAQIKITPVKVAHHKKAYLLVNDTATAKAQYLNDTINPAKKKFKIVIEDDKGNKKEYNSISELPAQEQKEFLDENPAPPAEPMVIDANDIVKYVSAENYKMSPEFKKQMADIKIQSENLRKQFNSPEWRKKIKDLQVQSEKLQKQFNSDAWKAQQKAMQEQGERIQKYYNSPEWNKQVAEIQAQADKIAAQFNSPEWKKQIAELQKQSVKLSMQQINSPEFKKQIKLLKIQAEKIKQQYNSPEFKKQMQDMQLEFNHDDKNAAPDSVKSAN